MGPENFQTVASRNEHRRDPAGAGRDVRCDHRDRERLPGLPVLLCGVGLVPEPDRPGPGREIGTDLLATGRRVAPDRAQVVPRSAGACGLSGRQPDRCAERPQAGAGLRKPNLDLRRWRGRRDRRHGCDPLRRGPVRCGRWPVPGAARGRGGGRGWRACCARYRGDLVVHGRPYAIPHQ
ncbi:hypothetical protein DSECCO2_382330 [anaerobic digester metagenome]